MYVRVASVRAAHARSAPSDQVRKRLASSLLDEEHMLRALVQRVTGASVTVDGEVVGAIGPGLAILVGVTHGDDEDAARYLAERTWHLRVFPDEQGRMNRSLADTTRQALVVSQFTLYADTSRGRRPSWVNAAPPELAEPLVEHYAETLAGLGARVATGVFGAHMRVALTNDGPVTILLER
jgi:D-aminoacyl-tRNA deacylase